MIKNIAISLLIGISFSAFAGKSPESGTDVDSQLITFDEYPRFLHFQSAENALTKDGEILVCDKQFTTVWGKCQDEKGNNKWKHLSTVQIPGFKAHAYKIVNSGSGGYRNLYVFFKKVN